MGTDPYVDLGVGYATRRSTDPRIAAAVDRALRGAATVVDVGAGTGSYETARTVLAVEPSATMIDQRPPGSASVVRAHAEALPLRDRVVDHLAADLDAGRWHRRHGTLLARGELDLGYRLVVAGARPRPVIDFLRGDPGSARDAARANSGSPRELAIPVVSRRPRRG